MCLAGIPARLNIVSMKNLKVLITVLCFLLLGISPNFVASQNFEIEPIVLKGEEIFKNEFGILDLNKIDSLYVLSTKRDTVFRVYNISEEFIGAFGKIGRGPGEIRRVAYVPDLRNYNNNIELLIVDNQVLVATIIDLKKSLSEEKIIPVTETKLPRELFGIQSTDVYLIDEYTLFGIYDQ